MCVDEQRCLASSRIVIYDYSGLCFGVITECYSFCLNIFSRSLEVQTYAFRLSVTL